MIEKLLPCPLCRKEAVQSSFISAHGWIRCENESCLLSGTALHPDAWQALPRESDAFQAVIQDMKERTCDDSCMLVNGYEVAQWMARLSKIVMREGRVVDSKQEEIEESCCDQCGTRDEKVDAPIRGKTSKQIRCRNLLVHKNRCVCPRSDDRPVSSQQPSSDYIESCSICAGQVGVRPEDINISNPKRSANSEGNNAYRLFISRTTLYNSLDAYSDALDRMWDVLDNTAVEIVELDTRLAGQNKQLVKALEDVYTRNKRITELTQTLVSLKAEYKDKEKIFWVERKELEATKKERDHLRIRNFELEGRSKPPRLKLTDFQAKESLVLLEKARSYMTTADSEQADDSRSLDLYGMAVLALIDYLEKEQKDNQ